MGYRRRAPAPEEAKSQFLANMSHKIRTPMNGVLGMAEVLLGAPLSELQRRYLESLHHSGENLLDIIDNILDLSKPFKQTMLHAAIAKWPVGADAHGPGQIVSGAWPQ